MSQRNVIMNLAFPRSHETEEHPLTETGHDRLLPMRDRQALLERQERLATEAASIDAEQQRLAVEFARLRRELVALRELLWPSADGRAFDKTRRPPVAGPEPIPPPLVDALPVRGRALLRADHALALSEIHRVLHLRGHVLLAADPVKQRGDALGYEERRGTVRRVARGTYAIGTLTPHRRRVLQRDESFETPTASRRSRP